MELREQPLQVSLAERLGGRVNAELKRWFAEEPPGAMIGRGAAPPSIGELQRIASTRRVSGLLPYESYEPEGQLFFNGDAAGILIELTPAVGVDLKRVKVLSGLFSQGLRAGTNVQITLWADPDIHGLLARWRAARPRDGSFYSALADRRLAYLRGGNWASLFDAQVFLLRDWRVFLSITRPIDPRQPDPSELDYLIRTRAAVEGILDSADLGHLRVDAERFIRTLDGMLNPSTQPRPAWRWDPEVPLAEQVVDRDTQLLVSRDCLSLIHRGFNVSVLPFSVRQFPLNWAAWQSGELIGALYSNVQRLPCPVLCTQTIHVTDQVAALGSARLRSARATQMMDSPVGRFVPAWKDRKHDWDYVVGHMEDGHKLLRSHWQIIAFARAGEEEFCLQRVRSVFESLGWQLSQDRFTALTALRCALPLSAGPMLAEELKRLGLLRSRLTWNAINLAPLTGEWKGTGTPLLMTFGRRGQVQFIDFFDNRKGNYNVAVAATSGAGKSFFTNELVVATRSTGGRVSIIDAGRSYLNICRLLDGQYVTFSRAERPCLNPFSTVNADEFQEEELPLLKQLHAQMASPEAPLSALQLAVLEQAIVASWKKYGQQAEPTAVAAELAAMGTQDAQARDLATMLYPYTRDGSYGRYFNGASTISLHDPLVVLELDDLVNTPDLQSVVLLSLMLSITSEMYRHARSVRKLAIIDEAWQLMGQGQAGKFIERGYRTARKYGGAFMTITQGINDYYKSALSRAALENSDFLCLLRQKPETVHKARAEQQIAMDDGLQELLLSLDKQDGMYSELAIKGPEGVSVGRLLVDPFSEKLYSTQGPEFQFVQDAQARGLSLVEAVDELVRRSSKRRATT
jgi:conjugal transfer ATP-binding protein TraC